MAIKISAPELAALFDSTALHVTISKQELKQLCQDAIHYGFKTVAVNHWSVPICKEYLRGSNVGITSNVSYPLGAHLIHEKVVETQLAIEQGPTDIDYVLNLSELKAGNFAYLEEEMQQITEVCHAHKIICKVILETYYLTDDEIVKMCEIAKRVGIDFVKTSTGQIKSGGAKLEHVKLMKEALQGSNVGIKPAGGIRSLVDVLAMIEAGATRIGASSAVAIMEEYEKRKDDGFEVLP